MPSTGESFEPRSDRVYSRSGKEKPAERHVRRVFFKDRVVRIDVVENGILREAWNLDDQGRAVLGLLAEPASDGAVRVEYTRDKAGAVTSERRWNIRGEELR